MGWRTSWRVICEQCSCAGPLRNNSSAAEQAAVKKGWLRGQVYGMAMHLCPACRAGTWPEWWPDESGLCIHWETGE